LIQDEHGKWRLTAQDIHIGPDDMEIEDDVVCTYLETWFDVDERLGTSTFVTDHYINLYADYSLYTENLELYYFIHHANGNVSEEILVEDVSAEEQKMILFVMKEAGMDRMIEEYEAETRKSVSGEDNDIYLLFTCDVWKSRSSMRIHEVIKGFDMLLAVVANSIFEGDMDYRGLSNKNGLLELIRDYEKGKVDLDSIGNGFVRKIDDEIVEMDNAADDYRMAYDWLNMGEAEFMNLLGNEDLEAEDDEEWGDDD
jgi:hypothetical protein